MPCTVQWACSRVVVPPRSLTAAQMKPFKTVKEEWDEHFVPRCTLVSEQVRFHLCQPEKGEPGNEL